MNGGSSPVYEWDSSMYRLAVAQLDAAALRMGLDDNVWERLRHPQRAQIVSFPFRRDDYKTVDTLVGYRVQHLLTMGPTQGGTRAAPDEQVMSWIMDTYSQQKGHTVPGVVTGKPVEIGGSLGRLEATGRGVLACVVEACRHLSLPLENARVVVQGYGNVGAAAAKIAKTLGARVIAGSD